MFLFYKSDWFEFSSLKIFLIFIPKGINVWEIQMHRH